MKYIRENTDEAYKLILDKINYKLENNGYIISKDLHNIEGIETRVFQWSNIKDNHAIQIIWDGKEQCFGLGEFTSLTNLSIIEVKDIIVIPFKTTRRFFRRKYLNKIIDNLINALNEKLTVTLNIKDTDSKLKNLFQSNSTLTFERKTNLGTIKKEYIDFKINGESLADLTGGILNNIGKFGWGNNKEFELTEFYDFKNSNQSKLDNGFFSAYVCSDCGDERCGSLMFKITRKQNIVIWSNFIWGDGNIETVENPDDKINIEPIVFDKIEYELALNELKKMIIEE